MPAGACRSGDPPRVFPGAEPTPPRMTTADPHDLTGLVRDARQGDPTAVERLFPLVYEELRRIASQGLARERSGHTLNTTALVHEAYLKLVDQDRASWNDRAHFLAVAATAMRRILVDHARRQKRQKRGGGRRAVTLDEARVAAGQQAEDLLALDQALSELAIVSERLSRVVECRYFAGLTIDETAAVLGVTGRTVDRDWQKARAWLYARLHEVED
jgi:RNA polymerase sigma factor (TIGR02999 family)